MNSSTARKINPRAAKLALLLTLIAPMTVADYQKGLEAYQAGNYDVAYYEWINVATGNEKETHPAIRAESQYALAMLYWLGQGVSQDTSAAAVWLQEAAEINHAGAQTKLGFLYLQGDGVPQSNYEAFKWFQMAASQDDADAQYNLGVMYRDGLGVSANRKQSQYWFSKAAANGDAVSAGLLDTQPIEMDAPPPAEMQTEELAVAKDNPVEPEVTLTETEEPQQGRILSDEDWIRARNPEHFTIQVIALQKPDKLWSFMAENPDWSPFAIYQQQWKGRPLYVLVQGDYPEVADARAASRRFPTSIQDRGELWIRRFMMIQGLLQ